MTPAHTMSQDVEKDESASQQMTATSATTATIGGASQTSAMIARGEEFLRERPDGDNSVRQEALKLGTEPSTGMCPPRSHALTINRTKGLHNSTDIIDLTFQTQHMQVPHKLTTTDINDKTPRTTAILSFAPQSAIYPQANTNHGRPRLGPHHLLTTTVRPGSPRQRKGWTGSVRYHRYQTSAVP